MVDTGRILVDTGIFIALFDERDDHHQSACRIEKWLDSQSILLPWPILYETLNTRLVNRLKRDPAGLAKFGAIARSPKTELLDDAPYREMLWAFFDQSLFRSSLSLLMLCFATLSRMQMCRFREFSRLTNEIFRRPVSRITSSWQVLFDNLQMTKKPECWLP